MPEGPEIRLASNFINLVASKTTFGGKVIKGEKATKLVEVPFEAKEYTINAEPRGKELKVYLTEILSGKSKKKPRQGVSHLLFRFGMSGCFKYTLNDEEHIPKHAHLRFITKDTKMMLSFVDYRRFGKWVINGEWGEDRGPDPISNYEEFRSNILTNLKAAAFNGPICEVMLNQKYFNGIGNYLRAEILYRCSIPPFERARDVLTSLNQPNINQANIKIKLEDKNEENNVSEIKSITFDILQLCNTVPNEVLGLPAGGKGYDGDHDPVNGKAFTNWLQCYSKDGMKNLVDKNGRTIWFHGLPGKLTPANAKSRAIKTSKKKKVIKQHVKIDPDQESEKNHTTKNSKIKSEYIEGDVILNADTIKNEYASNTTTKIKKECIVINRDSATGESNGNQNHVIKKKSRKSRTSQQNI